MIIVINKLGLSYARNFGLLDRVQLEYSSVLTQFSLLEWGEGAQAELLL